MCPATFNALIRSCPDLNYFDLDCISGIGTPKMAGAFLDSFLDMSERSIEICFYRGDCLEIWEMDATKRALKRLKESGGPEVIFSV